MAKKKRLSLEPHPSIIVLRNEGYTMLETAKKLKISYKGVHYSLQIKGQLALTRTERDVEGQMCN